MPIKEGEIGHGLPGVAGVDAVGVDRIVVEVQTVKEEYHVAGAGNTGHLQAHWREQRRSAHASGRSAGQIAGGVPVSVDPIPAVNGSSVGYSIIPDRDRP